MRGRNMITQRMENLMKNSTNEIFAWRAFVKGIFNTEKVSFSFDKKMCRDFQNTLGLVTQENKTKNGIWSESNFFKYDTEFHIHGNLDLTLILKKKPLLELIEERKDFERQGNFYSKY